MTASYRWLSSALDRRVWPLPRIWSERGETVVVFEAGARARRARWRSGGMCGCSRAWPELVDPAAARLLGRHGVGRADARLPDRRGSGSRGYLAPLRRGLGDRIRYGARSSGCLGEGRDRLVSAGRAEQPFTVHVVTLTGVESRMDARAVIDASGTWTQPNPAGADGYPAIGERAAAAPGVVTYLPPTAEQAAATGRPAYGRGR